MIVSFMRTENGGFTVPVDYGFPDGAIPRENETVIFDGSDAAMPAGAYRCGPPHWTVGERGPSLVTIYLTRRAD